MMQEFQYDPPTRRGGASSRASRETFREAVVPTLRHRQKVVYEVILAHPNGVTAKEIAAQLNVPLHTISGRCTELFALTLIRKDGRREDSAVYVPVYADAVGQTSMFGDAA